MTNKHEPAQPNFNAQTNRNAELWYDLTPAAIEVLVAALSGLVRPTVSSIEAGDRRVPRAAWDKFWVSLSGALDNDDPELFVLNLRSAPTEPLRTVLVTNFEHVLKVEFTHISDVPSLPAVENFHAAVVQFAKESGAVQGLLSCYPRRQHSPDVTQKVLSPYHYSSGVADRPGQFDPHLTVFIGEQLLASLQNRDRSTIDQILTSPGAVKVFDLPEALVGWLNPELLAYWDGPQCDYDYEAGEREAKRIQDILNSI